MTKDKNKTLMIVGLGVVLLAVGAFQFIGKGSTPTPTEPVAAKTDVTPIKVPTDGATTAKKDEVKADPQKDALLAYVKAPLQKRDPFAPGITPVAPQTTPTVAQTAPATQQKPTRSNSSEGFRPGSGSVAPYSPLPGGEPGTAPIGTGNGNVTPGAPLRQPGEFAYKVKGVLSGPKPMAVFEDDSGNQRLVPLGGSVDGDSKVVGIEKGKVRIRHKGKDKVLNLSEGQ